MVASTTDRSPMTPCVDPADERRWEAVVGRDPAVGDAFYYSVRTTGVYCRPSCSARLARRENVRFHATCTDAELAGFRPCRRCRPNDAPLAERRTDAIAAVCRSIAGAPELPTLAALAAQAGMSRYHFARVFAAVTGLTPKAYIAAERDKRFRARLSDSVSITDAIYAAGFASSGRAYAGAATALGMTPTQFRRGGIGAIIRFAAGECSLGAILVAASERGICAILLGDDADVLARDLQDRFGQAELVAGDDRFEQWVATVVGLIEAPRLGCDLPLDVRGTVFQMRVWNALCAIPAGATASYAQIAASIGAPGAVRAVARACGANPLAVAIPCHRVVRTDGGLSGYRWGVERKRVLLEREAAS